jgi:hypothetical protein
MLRLTALFKDEVNPRWKKDREYFLPSLAGRRVCRLSADATQFLIDNLVGRNSKSPTFILIEPEGDVRMGGVQIFEDWFLAVKVALDEGVYIYNARTKKTSRPVWAAELDERTFQNMTFEPVRLVADEKTYNEKLPKVTTRLFAEEAPR